MNNNNIFIVKSGYLHCNFNSIDYNQIIIEDFFNKKLHFSDCSYSISSDNKLVHLYLLTNNNTIYLAKIETSKIETIYKQKSLNTKELLEVHQSNSTVTKLTSHTDGVFISSQDGSSHYCQIEPTINTIPIALSENHISNQEFDNIIKAKNVFSKILVSLTDSIPNVFNDVEKEIIKKGKTLFEPLKDNIREQKEHLNKIFDKPLSEILKQFNNESSIEQNNIENLFNKPSDTNIRTTLLQKSQFDQILTQTSAYTSSNISSTNTINKHSTKDNFSDLFEDFSSVINESALKKLLNMDMPTLLQYISGNKPFSKIVDDIFDTIDTDKAIDNLFDIFQTNKLSQMINSMNPKSFLEQKVSNNFFETLYKHYFPNEEFTYLELISFTASIAAYTIFEAQGKHEEFIDAISDDSSIEDIINQIQHITQKAQDNNGDINTQLLIDTNSIEASTALKAIVSMVSTFSIGTFCAVSYGTGLITSSTSAGVALAISIVLTNTLLNKNDDYIGVIDAIVANFINSFITAFITVFLGTLICTMLGILIYYIHLVKSRTPISRLTPMKLSILALGLLGGLGISKYLTPKLKNLDNSSNEDYILTITLAIVGGTFMGTGLHFLGFISGTTCLPLRIDQDKIVGQNIPEDTITRHQIKSQNIEEIVNTNDQNLQNINYANMNENITYIHIFKTTLALEDNPKRYSMSFVKQQDFVEMDNSYRGNRELLFSLGQAELPLANIVIGVHGIGGHVFPNLVYVHNGNTIEYTRPMSTKEFTRFLTEDDWFQAAIRDITGMPVIKLLVCFSALPKFSNSSLGKSLAKTFNANVYAGNFAVYPWLNNNQVAIPPGGWVHFEP
jgi:hypothetical protein